VRSISSDLRMDYTAVGQTTHLAARMEQLASPGSIRLTAGTLHLAEGYIDVSPLGPVPIKGLGSPVEVFELIGAGPARSRFLAAPRRGLTRFVGRSTELEQLRDAFDQASHSAVRWSPWSESRASANHVSSGSSLIRATCRAAWSSKVRRSPMAKPPR